MTNGKLYENTSNGKKVQVIDDDGSFVIISGGARINKNEFLNHYTEVVDVNSFFNQSNVQNLAEQLKSVDPRVVSDVDTGRQIKRLDGSGNQISYENPTQQPNITNKDAMIQEYLAKQKTIAPYKEISDDDEILDKMVQMNTTIPIQPPQSNTPQPPVVDDTNVLIPQKPKPQHIQKQDTQQPQPDNITENEQEVFKFFKGFKKIYDAEINLTFTEKIAEPEFLKMMSNNFDADVIKFYTLEIMKNIYKDSSVIQDMIYNQLKEIVFGKEKDVVKEEKPTLEKINDTSSKPLKRKTEIKKDSIKEEKPTLEKINDVSSKPLKRKSNTKKEEIIVPTKKEPQDE